MTLVWVLTLCVTMIIGIIASIPMGIPFRFLIYLFTDANHPFILGDIATFIVMAVVWYAEENK